MITRRAFISYTAVLAGASMLSLLPGCGQQSSSISGEATIKNITSSRIDDTRVSAKVSFAWKNTTNKVVSFNDVCKLRAFTPEGADHKENTVSGGDDTVNAGETIELTGAVSPIPKIGKNTSVWYFEIIPKNAKFKSFERCETAIARKEASI